MDEFSEEMKQLREGNLSYSKKMLRVLNKDPELTDHALLTKLEETKKQERLGRWRNETILSRDEVNEELDRISQHGRWVDLTDKVQEELSVGDVAIIRIGRDLNMDTSLFTDKMSVGVSRKHAEIKVEMSGFGPVYKLCDVGSRNHTYICPNGDSSKMFEVNEGGYGSIPAFLRDNDVIMLGKKDAYRFRIIKGHPILIYELGNDSFVPIPEKKKDISSTDINLDHLLADASIRGRSEVIIGRNTPAHNPDMDLYIKPIISTETVSRRHASLIRGVSGGYILTDLGSHNGTRLVRGDTIISVGNISGVELVKGDKIYLGGTNPHEGVAFDYIENEDGVMVLRPREGDEDKVSVAK